MTKVSFFTVLMLLLYSSIVFAKPASSSELSSEGLMIKAIHVIKFPIERNGKKFDKNNKPDLYFRFYEDGKKRGKSNVKKNCIKGRIPILAGGKMPFRVEQNKRYSLQLFDHDSDRGIGSNKDEAVSSRIQILWRQLISDYGKKESYLIKDPRYNDVQFILMVEHVGGTAAAGNSAYIKHVKAIDQEWVLPKRKVMEGCGPIAGAMIMGYWQTEHGYKIMHADDRFNGTQHPTQTIKQFRKKADTKAWGDQPQSATRKMNMVDALQYFVKQANKRLSGRPKLKVDMIWSIRRWAVRRSRLKKELREGSPVILLLKSMPPCLKGKWVNATKVVADHYIVAVGFDNTKKEYYVMPGWEEKPKSASSGPDVHGIENKAHCKCTYSEIKNSDPSLIWIKR